MIKRPETLQAAVEFENVDDHIRIIVSDEGKGFDAEKVMSDVKIAHGLLSIRHRLSLLGCNMEVTSEPGKGTRTMIDCPNPRSDT